MSKQQDFSVYLVGGAVRDELLGRAFTERDWVVVGATPEEMVRLGYRPVGRDFPVFLHPETGEEYALARTERKSGHGYQGFEFYCAPEVTLEDDLIRRDLTVNAMAKAADGTLIDPHGGRRDLKARVLRHVSPAFAEDPLRILRVARFAARFHSWGFSIAPETLELMRTITASGEVEHLVAERVWQETERALGEPSPQVYIQTLRDSGALAVLMPEVDRLFGVPQRADYHPEVDTGIHTLMALEQAAKLSDDPAVRFAVLVHDLGKGITPEDQLPRHINHENAGVPLVEALCQRLKVPTRHRELALAVTRFHLLCHTATQLRPATLLKLMRRLDALRRPERLEQFLLSCEADARGRTGFEKRDYPASPWLRTVAQRLRDTEVRDLVDSGLKGQKLANAIEKRQIARISELKEQYFL